jgi:tetratricopeptide (TPR) repeat protein
LKLEAMGQFEAAARPEQRLASYYLDPADAYRLARRHEEAIAAYGRAQELDPGNEAAAQRQQEWR